MQNSFFMCAITSNIHRLKLELYYSGHDLLSSFTCCISVLGVSKSQKYKGITHKGQKISRNLLSAGVYYIFFAAPYYRELSESKLSCSRITSIPPSSFRFHSRIQTLLPQYSHFRFCSFNFRQHSTYIIFY